MWLRDAQRSCDMALRGGTTQVQALDPPIRTAEPVASSSCQKPYCTCQTSCISLQSRRSTRADKHPFQEWMAVFQTIWGEECKKRGMQNGEQNGL